MLVQDLTKRYDGKAVVDGVSFAIPKGKVLSLIGPNGAGKSTVMGMISRLIVSDAGQEHGGHHHGHGHGPHGGSMPAPDSLEGLLLRCGHALHHGGHGQKDLFAGLTQQEQDDLRGLLPKLVGSWQEN